MGHSKNFEKVKSYYNQGLWKLFQVKNSVKKGWITETEYAEITGEDYGG